MVRILWGSVYLYEIQYTGRRGRRPLQYDESFHDHSGLQHFLLQPYYGLFAFASEHDGVLRADVGAGALPFR